MTPWAGLSWGARLAVLGALAIITYLYLALFVPGTLALSPFTIQDDGRQFHSWMPRLADPALLRGDRIADYWQSVSPIVYQLPFRAAALLGMDPLLFGRLLPAGLLALSLWAGWRVARQVTGEPRTAFFAAAFLFAYLIHDDSIFSATPRAFSPPLLLLALDAILARRNWWAAALLALLAAIYPSTAIAGFGIFGLAQLRRGTRWPLVLPWRADPPLAVAAAAIVAAGLLLQGATEQWAPVVTLEQALQLPNMNRPDGRSSIVDEDGEIGWLCQTRVGFLPEAAPCRWGTPLAAPINALLLLPLVWLAVRSARGRPDAAGAERTRLYLHALVACTVCFAVAAAFAFALHFPGRYTQRVLGPLEWLAIGHVLGEWAGRRRVGRAVLAALLVALMLTPLPGFVRPDPGLMRTVQRLPNNARIAGVSEELGAIPALTGRAITAATEQAIPWHLGYYRPFERELQRALVAVSTPEAAALRAALTGSDYLLVDRALLERSTLPERYGQVVPEAAGEAQALLARGPSEVQRRAAQCVRYRGPTAVLLSARCLSGRPAWRGGPGRP